MRHPIAAVLIVVSTVVAGAQSSSQQASAPGSVQAGTRAAVSGCLAAGPTAGTFTLTTAEADLTAVGTTGGTAASPEGGAPKPDVKTVIYTLTPRPGVDLAAHIGHTVEVSGTEPPAAHTGSTAENSRNTTPAGGAVEHRTATAQTTARTEIVARRLTVSAVKMVANDCHIHK